MIKKLLNRLRHSHSRTPHPAHSSCPVEPLEPRLLLAAGPRVSGIVADNRGLVFLNFDSAIRANTITAKSVAIFTAGRDKKLGTADDVKQKVQFAFNAPSKQLTLFRALKANTPYRVFLNASLIKGANGLALDGEFKGATKKSGDTRPGGNYDVTTKIAKIPVARFLTAAGEIDVLLFKAQTPKTVKNFTSYANRRLWDGTFFHRSEDYFNGTPFVIQGGGFRVNSDDQIVASQQLPPVMNEPFLPTPRNVFGTIAMARTDDGDPDTHDDENSATNQWFFNLSDNSPALDNQNGGFTVFGRIIGARSRNTINFIGQLPTVDLNPGVPNTPFESVPVQNNNLVFVNRVALKMDVARTG